MINPQTRIEKESKCSIEKRGFADPPASTVHASKKLKIYKWRYRSFADPPASKIHAFKLKNKNLDFSINQRPRYMHLSIYSSGRTKSIIEAKPVGPSPAEHGRRRTHQMKNRHRKNEKKKYSKLLKMVQTAPNIWCTPVLEQQREPKHCSRQPHPI